MVWSLCCVVSLLLLIINMVDVKNHHLHNVKRVNVFVLI